MAILNTRLPPFDDPRVRKALNYAVDRGELARRRMAVGQVTATPTCQVLIPGIAGYRPYCPYTTGQGFGRWLAPDMDKAHELVRESGTAGQQVTVWEPATRYDPDGAYFVEVLNALGYKADLHIPRPDFGSYVDHVLTPGQRPTRRAGLEQRPPRRRPDPAPALRQLRRRTPQLLLQLRRILRPTNRSRIQRGSATGDHHPTAANQLWRNIDKQLVDAAPWVPAWTTATTGLAAARVGNITPHFLYPILLDQLWVQ